MSQTFILKLASDSLISDAQKIGVPATQLQQIAVKVTASIANLANTGSDSDSDSDSDELNTKTSAVNTSLNLSYEIKLPSIPLLEQLQWPLWNKDKIGFEDYLWEQTCLECFITNNPVSYVEINASPNGRYAVYQFADYRTPATLPPTPLLIKDSQGPVRIQWHDTALTSSDILTKQRRVSISLDKLPYPILNPGSTALIHPCVILYFNEIPLYFAPYHASPADFHQRQHWSTLQLDKRL